MSFYSRDEQNVCRTARNSIPVNELSEDPDQKLIRFFNVLFVWLVGLVCCCA